MTRTIVMLRLRNRILNRFKNTKPSLKAKKIISKKASTTKSGKTLRVVSKPVISNKIAEQKSGKTSPPKTFSAKHLKALTALVGQRRVFLRNRRLMNIASARPILAF